MKYKSFYRFIEFYSYELSLRGEGIIIAYKVFEQWLKQEQKSLEELYVEDMNRICCYYTREGIEGLLKLAEQWINTIGKKFKHLKIYADVKIYSKSFQLLKAY